MPSIPLHEVSGIMRPPPTAVRKVAGCILTNLLASASYCHFRILCGGTIHGIERLDALASQGCIIAANHSSYLDWMVLGAVFRYRYGHSLIFLAKEHLFHHPVFGSVMQYEKCIEVSEDGIGIISYAALANERCLCIFPEGRRTRDGKLGNGRFGVIKLAIKFGIPILPVGLKGFFESWPPGTRIPRPSKCSIEIGIPRHLTYPVGSHIGDEMLNAETTMVMKDIESLTRSVT